MVGSHPQRGHTWGTLSARELDRGQHPGLLLGFRHVDTLCLPRIKTLDSRRESRRSAEAVVFMQRAGAQ